MANPDTLQKFGLIGGLVFAVVAGGLYLQTTTSSGGTEPLKTVRAVPPPSSGSAAPSEPEGTIPVGVLGMMQKPRVVPPESMPAVKAALKGVLGDLGDCYDAAGSSHEPDGTLYVKLHVTGDGGTRDVQLAFRGPSGRALKDCASGVLSGMAVGDDAAVDTLVSWPLRWTRGKGLRLR